MSELTEKRQVFRSEIRLPVLYRRKAPGPIKAGVGWTHNLSDEGACLELSDRSRSRRPSSSCSRRITEASPSMRW